jgi:glycosyltransferase involved in cell wall biosynthesis
VRARHGLGERYLLFVSVFEPRKNIPLLVDAFEIFRREYPHGQAFQLALAGGAGWRGAGIAESVRRRASNRPSARLRPRGGPAVALPRRRTRGDPLAVREVSASALEAMACGTVPRRTPSLPEVVGDAGELSPRRSGAARAPDRRDHRRPGASRRDARRASPAAGLRDRTMPGGFLEVYREAPAHEPRCAVRRHPAA